MNEQSKSEKIKPILCELWQQKPMYHDYKNWGRFTCVVSPHIGKDGQTLYNMQGCAIFNIPLNRMVKIGSGYFVLRPVNLEKGQGSNA